jgi:NitT/TauT family transport system substrate-binding protein
MNGRRRISAALAGLAAATAVAAPGAFAQTAPAKLTKITMAQAVDAVSFLPIYIARHFKYFEQEGLDIHVIVTGSSGPDIAALIAGEVQFAASAGAPVFNAWHQGQKLIGIQNIFNNTTTRIVISNDAAKRIGFDSSWNLERKMKAMKGMKIGMTRAGALTDSFARSLVTMAGYVPDRDVEILAVGSGAPMTAAVKQGKVDLATQFAPFTEQGIASGDFKLYIDLGGGEVPAWKENLVQALFVRPDWAAKNEDTVRRMVRALDRANKWVADSSPPELAKVLKGFFPSIQDDALLEAARLNKLAVRADGRISKEAAELAMQLHITGGGMKAMIPWDEVFTNKYH